MANIKILPSEQQLLNPIELKKNRNNRKLDLEHYVGFYNAKAAIHGLMKKYNIARNDEVFISTTSNLNYVASCVTCTIFNYGKPSRVITENTKMIYVIHEFGFMNTEIYALKEEAARRKIPLVEDSAHSMDSYDGDKRLGEIGDYGIYSLPKFFTVTSGGILRSTAFPSEKDALEVPSSEATVEKLQAQDAMRDEITLRRRRNYIYLRDNMVNQKELFHLAEGTSPFLYAFYTEKKEQILVNFHKEFNAQMEFFPLHVKNLIGIPTNPFIETSDLSAVVDVINRT